MKYNSETIHDSFSEFKYSSFPESKYCHAIDLLHVQATVRTANHKW